MEEGGAFIAPGWLALWAALLLSSWIYNLFSSLQDSWGERIAAMIFFICLVGAATQLRVFFRKGVDTFNPLMTANPGGWDKKDRPVMPAFKPRKSFYCDDCRNLLITKDPIL